MKRAGAIALVLILLARSWSSAPPETPGQAPSARTPRPAPCCCEPCPGPPACPCDHGRLGGSTTCEKGTDGRPLAASSVPSTGPTRLACEELQRPDPPRFAAAPSDPELLPLSLPSAERIDKVPIA